MTFVPYTLPPLPYDYSALEPVISAEIMHLHHQKHHQGYINNLNEALKKLDLADTQQDLTRLIALEPTLRFNGGGHINHSLFWEMLAPIGQGGGVPPKHGLLKLIEKFWGTFDNFLKEFIKFAAPIQGSGWAWLAFCPEKQELMLHATANQDPLEATTGKVPLLGVDVWEHAYYLQYKNVRLDYLKAIPQVINWGYIEKRFSEITN
ncbi:MULTISPECIES: superoxide dismutase [Chlamydia]|uniref:Superoxide dismutase n=2 Tax=Chlamydia TaxID=810 RepID=A0ABP2X570_CHLPS|nr:MULTISPECIES: superoxide dismutase [Chlamydia]AFS19368.1 superoxide dismutase [Chlamydia psittaci 84/55]AFS22564.1 superoxide dismutase [Chlamydia psittaci VS225]AGE74924.1 superoxide dismutase [Chlamydia psittaci Mat116]EPJ15698.1 iron/manganese superoxide dismutase family protein [Chlamydia psittaci 02DC18]EPJ16869.1 iron/manganese superoxide dismutase family protein [Chlamydia psittaci 02DC22]EPJ20035.1 iron/manganese superoxide dismutase family protein [Chlamydia psittaci 02DC21]EPJ21